MFSAFERLVAFRYLRSRRREGFISVIAWFSLLGICLGVATLIIVMAVMNGFRQELLDRILGLNSHITIAHYGLPIEEYKNLTARVAKMDKVKIVSPIIESQVMVTANGASTGALVRGITRNDLMKKSMIASNIKRGDLKYFSGTGSVIIGSHLAARLGVRIGDTVSLLSSKVNAAFFGVVPRVKEYSVVGIFEIGMYEYDSSMIFMPLEAAQLYFKFPDSVTQIEVTIDNPDESEEVAASIYENMKGQYGVTDWKAANMSFFNSLKVERNVMFLILTLIIIVAAFNIISSMIMLVNDKSKAIAILRTMGASRGAIMRIFMMAGASVGVVGTFLGFALGLSFSLNIETIRQWIESTFHTELFAAEIYFLSQLPAIVEAQEVMSVVGMALALSFLATIYPAWKAANINPAEGVRYE